MEDLVPRQDCEAVFHRRLRALYYGTDAKKMVVVTGVNKLAGWAEEGANKKIW